MSDRSKVTDTHRRRRAVVYVRQSTLGQVERNTESAARQYALRERAVELGWPRESVAVVDEDTGRSGASAAGGVGVKELVAEGGLGHVGVGLGVEVSRLARSSADWHQLLDLCALTATLIADSDGVYRRPTSTTGCCSGSRARCPKPSSTSSARALMAGCATRPRAASCASAFRSGS